MTITANFIEITESVNKPTKPAGPDSAIVRQAVTLQTGGSACNFGHDVEYQFEWGDGNLSSWGASERQHTYNTTNTYGIRAKARCKVNTNVESEWGETHNIIITETPKFTISIVVDPLGSGSVNRTPLKTEYENGETVILSPLAAPGYYFDFWQGDLSGLDNPAYIIVDKNINITAKYKTITGVILNKNQIPEQFSLLQNYPNPFNPETTIEYQLPEKCEVILSVFNMNGKLIKVLVNGYKNAGNYSVRWDATDFNNNRVPSGVYLYQMKTQKFTNTNKMILLK